MMKQPLKRRRGAEQGHGQLLPHDRYRHVDAFDARENVGHQIAPLIGFSISPIADLIVRCTVDVVEDRPWQPPPCHRAEIFDVVALLDTSEPGPFPVTARTTLLDTCIDCHDCLQYWGLILIGDEIISSVAVALIRFN
jgi:hypothetical protein